MVYTASTRSLALLEVLVHIKNAKPIHPPAKDRYVLYPVAFDAALVEELPDSSLPSDWDAEPPKDSTKFIGDAWIAGSSSAVLSVPSVIVPEERNYLLNPKHDFFSRIDIGLPVPCRFDPRLL